MLSGFLMSKFSFVTALLFWVIGGAYSMIVTFCYLFANIPGAKGLPGGRGCM